MDRIANGSDLTPAQKRELDDQLLGANPAAYWRARIDALLAEPSEDAVRIADVEAAGLSLDVLTIIAPTAADRELQRCLDAFALRHHIAEALARLVHAIARSLNDADRCLWADLATGPTRGKQVVDEIRAKVESDSLPLDRLFLGEGDQATGAASDVNAGVAFHVSWAWVERAMALMVSEGLDLNAGNNKLKHGLAVRPRDDERIDLLPVGPDADGNVPLSAFKSSVPVIDDISAAFLTRQLRGADPSFGSWEKSIINLRFGPMMAESLMMNLVYAAVFATAAGRHFAARSLTGPLHPGLPLGPTPDRFAGRVDGMRYPLTPPSSGIEPRPAIVEMGGRAVALGRIGPGAAGCIVEDTAIELNAQEEVVKATDRLSES